MLSSEVSMTRSPTYGFTVCGKEAVGQGGLRGSLALALPGVVDGRRWWIVGGRSVELLVGGLE